MQFDIVGISLLIFLAMTAISILIVVGFGLKNVIAGKFQAFKIAMIVAPFVVFFGAYGVLGDWTEAGVATFLIQLAVMGATLALMGLRNSFKS